MLNAIYLNMKLSFSIFYISDILDIPLKQEGEAGKTNPAKKGTLGVLSSYKSHNPL